MADYNDLEDENEESLSSDPEENLRIQNELLKIKMQAELGAEFGGDMSDLPPEVEQQILKQVMRFHEAQRSGEARTVGQQIGQEEWPLASSFTSAAALQEAYDDVERRLTEAHLHVGFLADYPLAVKWDFITQELMKKETFSISALEELQFGIDPAGDSESKLDDEPSESIGEDSEEDSGGEPSLQGVGFMGFIYEEFHPNHAFTIERYALDTLREIFERTIGTESAQLANPMRTDDGTEVPLESLVEKTARFHDLFAEIKTWELTPSKTTWDSELDDEGTAVNGTGMVEGEVRYAVVMDDGSESDVAGPYKIHFRYREGYWEVSFFQLHGFSWA